jgi:hypothetical protein
MSGWFSGLLVWCRKRIVIVGCSLDLAAFVNFMGICVEFKVF